MNRYLGATVFLALLGTVLLSNVLVDHFGIVSVGFGLKAPAAVFAVGLALPLRDVLQRTLGRGAVLAAIVLGAVLSVLVSPVFALASGVAFIASETLDFAVYTPLERRSWLGAVVASNVVGAVVDSYLFLSIAFHDLAFMPGQIVGKLWVTVATVVLILLVRVAIRTRRKAVGATVYLGGPINGCTDEEAHGWRETVKPILEAQGFDWIDPMERDYRGREMEPGIAAEIVENDKVDIQAADILLMNCPTPSVGTSMEILFGRSLGKRVVAVVPDDRPPSPWIVYHAETRSDSLSEVARSLGDAVLSRNA